MALPSQPSHDPMTHILGWLSAEPAEDCFHDLVELRRHLERWLKLLPSRPESTVCIDGFDARALDLVGRIKPRLLSAGLPVPRELYEACGRLSSGLTDLARAHDELADRLEQGADEGHATPPIALRVRAMRLLGEAFMLASMRGSEAPQGLWALAYRVFSQINKASAQLVPASDPHRSAVAGMGHFKRMASISALQPDSLTARELVWVYDYLELTSGVAEFSTEPILPESAAFWLDPEEDVAPIACVRRLAPVRRRLLYFSAARLSKRVSEQIEWLERRISDAEVVGLERDADLLDPDASGLPLGLSPVEVLALLGRLRERWLSPPSREHVRRPHLYSVQVCSGLRNLWQLHRGGSAPPEVAEWMVCNESAGGYGIISVADAEVNLSAGMALGLRRSNKEAWSICVVRWVRQHEGEQVELGLQVLATACAAVSIAFRGSEPKVTKPALLLPPMPGHRNNAAVLAPAGTYCSRRFVMVRETGTLYVAQGRVLSLDMQTADVELFQYEVDPFPI